MKLSTYSLLLLLSILLIRLSQAGDNDVSKPRSLKPSQRRSNQRQKNGRDAPLRQDRQQSQDRDRRRQKSAQPVRGLPPRPMMQMQPGKPPGWQNHRLLDRNPNHHHHSHHRPPHLFHPPPHPVHYPQHPFPQPAVPVPFHTAPPLKQTGYPPQFPPQNPNTWHSHPKNIVPQSKKRTVDQDTFAKMERLLRQMDEKGRKPTALYDPDTVSPSKLNRALLDLGMKPKGEQSSFDRIPVNQSSQRDVSASRPRPVPDRANARSTRQKSRDITNPLSREGREQSVDASLTSLQMQMLRHDSVQAEGLNPVANKNYQHKSRTRGHREASSNGRQVGLVQPNNKDHHSHQRASRSLARDVSTSQNHDRRHGRSQPSPQRDPFQSLYDARYGLPDTKGILITKSNRDWKKVSTTATVGEIALKKSYRVRFDHQKPHGSRKSYV